MKNPKRFIPLILIVILMIIGYFSGFYKVLNFDNLKYHHNELVEFVNANSIMTPFLFMAIYAVATALSIPGGLFLSLLGGYLFRQPWCTLYVLIGATAGATGVFLAAKTALGSFLRKKASPYLSKISAGFQKNAASYMLFLRLVPLFPFWLVNIAPAFFDVKVRTYIWTTLIGIAPASFVYTLAGRGLNNIFESEEKFSISAIFNWQLNLALICLGVLALVPIILRKWKEKHHDRQ